MVFVSVCPLLVDAEFWQSGVPKAVSAYQPSRTVPDVSHGAVSHAVPRAIPRLKRRPEFLRVAKSKRKWVARGLILQARNSISTGRVEDDAGDVRVGFTVSKKVGNAVKRNRARRRLREAALQVMSVHAKPGFDYVIIGRYATLGRRFDGLLSDLETALEKTGCHC